MNNLRYISPIIFAIWTFFLITNVVFAQISHHADLAGGSEVPPIFSESDGRVKVVGNTGELMYQINVTSLDKITAAHLHRGDTTENGEVLVTLFNSTKPTGIINGTLVQGTINSSTLQGSLAGNNLTSLIEFIKQNMTYVNVQTLKFPDGELRGTLTNSTK